MAVARKSRFEREDWLQLGLRVLAAEGPAGLTLERLCAAAERTRGSFYHHFRDHADFVAALAGHWRKQHTLTLMAGTQDGDAEQRLATLNELAVALDPTIETGMRRLADANRDVEETVQAVDAARMAYLEQLHCDAGLSARDAADVARIEYAAFVGAQHLFPSQSAGDAAELGRCFTRLVDAYRAQQGDA